MVAKFDGGVISPDGGGVLLREVEQRTGVIRRLAQQFTDHRDPEAIEHSAEEWEAKRLLGIALGYEDLNDHDQLRCDPLLAVLVGRVDPSGGIATGRKIGVTRWPARARLTAWSSLRRRPMRGIATRRSLPMRRAWIGY